jgi:hypothetical protein
MEGNMTCRKTGSPSEDERELRRKYMRARRFNQKASQEKIAWYMSSSQASVAEDENDNSRWEPGPIWHLRRAIAHALLVIGASENQAMDFWHEVNKYWVAADHGGSLVPDPFGRSYVQILTEVYVEIAQANGKPAYYKYEDGCRKMRESGHN